MLPVIAIVGRPNVGKSTLFNCLTHSRAALVADQPGLTRDRQYGHAIFENKSFIIVDTGGLGAEQTLLDQKVSQQVQFAISEADLILLVVDAKTGLNTIDEKIAQTLRSSNKTILLVVNKIEGLDENLVATDFYSLGFQTLVSIAAAHQQGIPELFSKIAEHFPETSTLEMPNQGIKVAIIGKPNAGKSTLINTILKEERVTVSDEPGTTRDSIFIPFSFKKTDYTLIDTAGIRRKSRVTDKIEKFSIIKTLQAIEQSHVVVLVIDATENVSEQDLKLLGHVVESGRALVIAINKWDAVTEDEKERVKSELDRRINFIDYAKWHFISAKNKEGVFGLFKSIQMAYQAATKELSTSELTKLLEQAIETHQPPLVQGRRIKLRYAHAGGKNPPVIVIHGNQANKLPDSYKKYLEKFYRKSLNLYGTPIRLIFKRSFNPYQ